jgi:hypothetical protein
MRRGEGRKGEMEKAEGADAAIIMRCRMRGITPGMTVSL